jgi:hypothetical protein
VRVPGQTAIAALGLLLAAGCSTFRYYGNLPGCQGQMLRAASPSGAECLGGLVDFDATVRTFVADKGTPDYLVLESEERAYLFYVERDQVAMFERERNALESRPPALAGIGSDAARFFEPLDQRRLSDARARARGEALGPPGPGAESETLADVVARCHALNAVPEAPACEVEYVNGAPSLLLRFGSRAEADEHGGRLSGKVARAFCEAANRASRPAFVVLSVPPASIRPFACELGRWEDWREVPADERASQP